MRSQRLDPEEEVHFDWKIPEAFDFLFEPAPYKVPWGGRGGAKSHSIAEALLGLGVQQHMRVLCAREVMKSLRESVHQLLKDKIQSMGLGPYYRVLENEIRCSVTNTKFMYTGMQSHTIESMKSFEGITHLWIEEGQSISKRSIDVADPTIRANGSEVWVSMNPKLATDYAYQYFVLRPPPGAIVRHVTYKDNPFFPATLEAKRAHAEATMDPEDYQNIWIGIPRGEAEGAIYANQMRMLRRLGRIGNVPPRKHLVLNAFLDLGSSVGNATAVWLHQQYGTQHCFVGYHAKTGKGLAYFWEWMQKFKTEFGLKWGKIYMPHDGAANMQGAELTDRVEIMEGLARREHEHQVEVVAVPRTTHLGAAIELVRERMVDVYIDEKRCEDGIIALSNYGYKWDEDRQIFLKEPHHNWASNGADAFRQWVQGYAPVDPLDAEHERVQAQRAQRRPVYVKGSY